MLKALQNDKELRYNKVMEKHWVALFSQTGSEIARLRERLGRWPDTIITNNSDVDSWCESLKDLKKRVDGRSYQSPKVNIKIVNPTQARTLNVLHRFAQKDSLVTLHGWLRIVPEDKCDLYDIYNGHPGLINVFPELKGKDPQVRAYEGNYATIGSVVHKCTAELDGGEIVEWAANFQDEFDTLDDCFAKLAHTSFLAWERFFDKV